MKALVQINGPGPCPLWTKLAEKYGVETVWMQDPAEAVHIKPDFILIQHVTQTADLRALGWDRLRCPIIGVCGDASCITNLDAVFNNLPVLTELYVDGYDYIEICRQRKLDSSKLIYQKFCADTLFPPLNLPKKYDWVFIGQVYPAYDVRLKHWRNDLVKGMLAACPNGYVTGSGWAPVLGRETTWIPQDEVNRYYAESRVVVSIDAHDGAGYTSTRPIEAMHAGHCVLIHEHDGSWYFKRHVRDGVHALYFKTLDEFRERLEWVRANEAAASEIARNGRDLVLQMGWTCTAWLERLFNVWLSGSVDGARKG